MQQVQAHCIDPPVWGDPSALNLFPVGTTEYDGGQFTFDGFTYDVRGSIYYPADDDGADQPFNARLAALGRVPIVICVHGAHSESSPSYLGYDYFQYQFARMGFVAISVDERQTDIHDDWVGWTQNIVRRAELAIASIAHMQQLDAAGPIFQDRIDFGRTGLMGHSRGGDCVIAIPERITLPACTIRARFVARAGELGREQRPPAGLSVHDVSSRRRTAMSATTTAPSSTIRRSRAVQGPALHRPRQPQLLQSSVAER